jgi:ABC-type lipoprotein release transport system permease subunit
MAHDQYESEGSVAGLTGTRVEITRYRLGRRSGPRNSREPGAGDDRLSGIPPDPLVLAGVVLAMLLLGLLATWIPARRALSIDALVLLREE